MADRQGSIRPVGTGVTDVVPVDLVFRSVGYRGVRLPGFPFDDRRGVIPSSEGRVRGGRGGANGAVEYVAGWIKRGPVGLIGTNKGDAAATVRSMMADLRGRRAPPVSADDAVQRYLRGRGVRQERARGRGQGRLREKMVDPADVSALLARRREHPED